MSRAFDANSPFGREVRAALQIMTAWRGKDAPLVTARKGSVSVSEWAADLRDQWDKYYAPPESEDAGAKTRAALSVLSMRITDVLTQVLDEYGVKR